MTLVVECQRCKTRWDEDDPEAKVCPCIDIYGSRQVVVVAESPPEGTA